MKTTMKTIGLLLFTGSYVLFLFYFIYIFIFNIHQEGRIGPPSGPVLALGPYV